MQIDPDRDPEEVAREFVERIRDVNQAAEATGADDEETISKFNQVLRDLGADEAEVAETDRMATFVHAGMSLGEGACIAKNFDRVSKVIGQVVGEDVDISGALNEFKLPEDPEGKNDFATALGYKRMTVQANAPTEISALWSTDADVDEWCHQHYHMARQLSELLEHIGMLGVARGDGCSVCHSCAHVSAAGIVFAEGWANPPF